MMYAVGKGVEQKMAEAAKWWTKAAEAGRVVAATNVSMVCLGATGVKSEAAKADLWTKLAAERSD